MKKIFYKASKKAGNILLKNLSNIKKITIKENQSSIVTNLDIESEKSIIKIIKKNYPSHNILSEECGLINNNSKYTWVIDPLDGTSNYYSGLPWFGIIICLLKNNEPIMGSIYLPFYNDYYYAEKNKGVYKNDLKITVSNENKLKNILFSYSMDYTDNENKINYELQIIKELTKKVRNIRSTNCIIDWLYTAEGKFGGCINQTTRIWDIAAVILLFKEAGGIITDIEGNKIQLDPKDKFKNYEILASNKYLHKKILNIINDSSLK